MIRFDEKYPAEIRNCAVDFTNALATGETLTGTPSVTIARGDMMVSNVLIVGSEVQFRLAGGTADTTTYRPQIVAVQSATSAGEVLKELVAVPISPEG